MNERKKKKKTRDDANIKDASTQAAERDRIEDILINAGQNDDAVLLK